MKPDGCAKVYWDLVVHPGGDIDRAALGGFVVDWEGTKGRLPSVTGDGRDGRTRTVLAELMRRILELGNGRQKRAARTKSCCSSVEGGGQRDLVRRAGIGVVVDRPLQRGHRSCEQCRSCPRPQSRGGAFDGRRGRSCRPIGEEEGKSRIYYAFEMAGGKGKDYSFDDHRVVFERSWWTAR